MIRQTDKALAGELVQRGLLTRQAADQYLAAIQNSTEGLQKYLLRHQYVSEADLTEALSAALGLERVNLRNLLIEKNVLDEVPVRIAVYFQFMPIKIDGKILTVASPHPLDIKLQDQIRAHLGFEPRFVVASEKDVLEAINIHYGLAADTIDRLSKEAIKGQNLDDSSGSWIEDLETGADDASIAKLVNEIILEAYKKRATDIHIEPYRNKVRLRYRIDGVLTDANIPLAVKQFLPSIISRIKLMANLSITEKRLPQDGSAIVRTKEQNLDLRVSTIPTPHGESMVIRILPTNVMLFSLERLGLSQKNLEIFRGLVRRPNGIVLVTGPTGSGKTTTLYACLNEINSPHRKIITLEDPIEYEVEGITQIQLNPLVNMNFAAGLRSVLRHDPDVIMVGEVRDMETAEIAIRTALTGHIVFSTLHTNDAASGVTRLLEMGLEPFLVASSIEAFVAQRLVRVICPKCKFEVKDGALEVKEEIARSFAVADVNAVKLFRGRGCEHCNQSGYYGRTALYEILPFTEEIRSAVLERQTTEIIKRIAVEGGMTTLRRDGWEKASDGLTTYEEVLNVTVKDEGPLEGAKNPQRYGANSLNPQSTVRFLEPETLASENTYDSRAYPRVPVKVGIRYSIVKQDSQEPRKLIYDNIEHSSITKDLSAGGLRFVSGYTLPVGTILELKIQMDKRERSINCLARICRVEDDAMSSMFNLAVYYLDVSSSDRARLTHYVKEFTPSQSSSAEPPGEGGF